MANPRARTARPTFDVPRGVRILAPFDPAYARVLTPQALEFFALLQRRFGARRKQLLDRRRDVQKRLDAGEKPRFLEETRSIRESAWKVAPTLPDLADRRVEITGP